MISSIEFFMSRISDVLLAPMLLGILFVFFFGFFSLGKISTQAYLRKKNSHLAIQPAANSDTREVNVSLAPGYDLQNYLCKNPNADFDEVEVYAFKRLELLKLVTKISPMLGLIATMIPMGPALKSLADGNIQGISENLSIAFAGVIFALVAASLTFVCVSVKKRWLAQDLLMAKSVIETKAAISYAEESNVKPITATNLETA